MKDLICYILLLLMLISCSKNKKDLQLELLTDQIFCIDNLDKQQFMEINYVPNKKYDSLSRNILNYRITNVSDKKYYIMFDATSLGTLERDYYYESMGRRIKKEPNLLSFNLYKNDAILDGNSTWSGRVCVPQSVLSTQKVDSLFIDYLKKHRLNTFYKLKITDIRFDFLSSEGFFIQPGETKYFTSIVNLPYRDNQKWVTNIDSLKPNFGSISLSNDSVYTKSRLSKNHKREIEENGYCLFDGIINSNKQPVKLISMPKK